MPNDPPADLAILIVGAARVIADRLGEAVERAGVDDMRTPFGYVIRVLAERDRTLTELADLLGVSKQAAIKIVDEMETRGFLTRHPDPDDRRVKLLRLTEKGRKVRRTALAASHAIERELRRGLGDPDVDALRAALEALLARHAALEDARAGRARAPW
ncbi:MAG: MarR family winged helix-turn-helix transcriptional regulator [Solirubrobacteraceae bacterium]